MELFFFSSTGNLQTLSKKVFGLLKVGNFQNIDSINVYQGNYSSCSFLGMKMKLEYNSYDYEEDYNFMITIQGDFTSDMVLNEKNIKLFADIVISILNSNTDITFAREVNDKLIIYKPDSADL
mgnify:CR=1 FL=1|jgi:hypothetical protein|tara:strand:+ start:3476 stop:3844 length:369 start_codon:yes stop_codon:yes gene_type:complete